MKNVISLLLIATMLSSFTALAQETQEIFEFDSSQSVPLDKKQWFGGLQDCDAQQTAPFDIYSLNQSTWILRQSKCDSWEAPFIYLLVGKEKALLLDTGAIENASTSPLAATIGKILTHIERPNLPLLVVHSHSHSDHTKGDQQFNGKANTSVIPAKTAALATYLGITKINANGSTLDLGNRSLTILATPGHHDEAISIYDAQEKWLLTGDTLYPGRVIVKDWGQFQDSIAMLKNFISTNPVHFILGGHIEMSAQPGVMYPIGSDYQPDEHSLVLTPTHLNALHARIKDAKKQPLHFDSFEIAPMNALQKLISGIAGFIVGS